MNQAMPKNNDCPSLTTVPVNSLGQRIARFERYLQVRFRNKYAPMVQALARYIPDHAVVFDVGANHGEFAKQVARLHGGNCRIFAFEPLEYNYTLMETVTRSFPNVKVIRAALSDRHGEADLFIPVKNASQRLGHPYGHLGCEPGKEFFAGAGANDRKVFRTTIQTETLDNLVERELLTRLDFIKVDVEGAENLVFTGGRQSLAKYRPAILCEIAPGLPERLGLTVDDSTKPLMELGYEMFITDEKTNGVSPCQKCHGGLVNYLFLHPQNPAPLPVKS